MNVWTIESTQKYISDYKRYEKKMNNELIATLNNAHTYYNSLNRGVNPLQIKSGFIHSEPDGIVAIDQRGSTKVLGKKLKLKQTRLYIYPDVERKILHFLKIGNKNSQSDDLKYCKKEVNQIRSQ